MRVIRAAIAAVVVCVGAAACGEGDTYAVARPISKYDQPTWSQSDSVNGYQCAEGYDEVTLSAAFNKGTWRDIRLSLDVAPTQVTVQYETINRTASGYIVHVYPESSVADRQQRYAASGTTRDTVNWHKPAEFRSISLCFQQ